MTGVPDRGGFLGGLEDVVRSEMAAADASAVEDLFTGPESGWLVDPAEVQTEQTGLRSLLGAVRALEVPRPGTDGPEREL